MELACKTDPCPESIRSILDRHAETMIRSAVAQQSQGTSNYGLQYRLPVKERLHFAGLQASWVVRYQSA